MFVFGIRSVVQDERARSKDLKKYVFQLLKSCILLLNTSKSENKLSFVQSEQSEYSLQVYNAVVGPAVYGLL